MMWSSIMLPIKWVTDDCGGHDLVIMVGLRFIVKEGTL